LAVTVYLGAVSTFMVQFGGALAHSGRGGLVEPLLLILLVIGIGVLSVPLIGLLVSRARARAHAWSRERRRLRAAASAELRARALMSELCPHGWRAQITLFGENDELLRTEANGPRARVALDWMELEGESGRAAVLRRVWAPTIGEALDAMVADRRTDETLEQIEHGAVADGALWPDL
jgi:hypothetical protein